MSKRTEREELGNFRLCLIMGGDRLGLTPAEIARTIGMRENVVKILLEYYKKHGAEVKYEPKND